MGAGSGGSAMLALKAGPMRRHDYDDAVQARAHAQGRAPVPGGGRRPRGSPFPFAAHAREILTAAAGRGLGEADFAALVEVLEGHGRGSSALVQNLPICREILRITRSCVESPLPAAKPEGAPGVIYAPSILRRFLCLIAFKEWAVTVRALAEGEQLVTLRKGGHPRGPSKHFQLEHERFFLYPTFDHQRIDLVRDSHQPELRRALEEGVWADGEPPVHALDARRRASPSPTACASAPGPRSPGTSTIADPRCRRRAVAVLRVDDRLRREAPGVEAAPPAARPAAAHLPHPAAGHGQGARRVRRLPLLAGAPARPALRGHARALRRGVRARRRGDRGDRDASADAGCWRAAPRGIDVAAPAPPSASSCVGIGGGGDVVGALAAAELARSARSRGGRSAG